MMRLWTIHPRYLDARGLVALWREALLAQKVLQGLTRGYRHHPQLIRFRAVSDPEGAIASYLAEVHAESLRRGYAFDAEKIGRARSRSRIVETRGQLLYEWHHLREKLKRRDPARLRTLQTIEVPESHASFRIVAGRVRDWERINERI
jgi:hypothetical protein